MNARHPASASLADLAGEVDTKSDQLFTFGNDGDGGADVDTKCRPRETFGNDGVGFIRVRKRNLNPTQPWQARKSVSFDLVRAVRVNGKPRHRFVLGLGSQKDTVTDRLAAEMLLLAIGRMKRHGFDEVQRRALLTELIRKGARRPTITACEGWRLNSSWTPYVDELAAFLRRAAP